MSGEIANQNENEEFSLIDNDPNDMFEFMNDPSSQSAGIYNKNSSQVLPLTMNLSHVHKGPTLPSNNAQGESGGGVVMHHLRALEDEHSSYLSVSKACLYFNQLASYGSSTTTPPSTSSSMIISSNLFEYQEYTNQFSKILQKVSNACLHHTDRRCRILALQSLSQISKAILGTLISTSLFLTQDDVDAITRLQDEICNDVVRNVMTCGLEDDDGVSSVAFESLARLIVDANEDLLGREIRVVTGQIIPSFFTALDGLFRDDHRGGDGDGTIMMWKDAVVTASGVQDVDGVVYNAEIRFRILSLLAPRIRTFLNRIQQMKTTASQLRCLSFLNEVVVFVCRSKRWNEQHGNAQPENKESFANRWYESDTDTMVQEYVDLILLPLLSIHQTIEGAHMDSIMGNANCLEVGISTAMHALMLCAVVEEYEGWLDHVISLAVYNLDVGLDYVQSHGGSTMVEWMDVAAALLIALRGVTLDVRRPILERVISTVVDYMPSTRRLPPDVIAPSLRMSDGSQRRPLRMGYWTEVAVSLLLPDRNSVKFSNEEYAPAHFQKASQVIALSSFLESATPVSLMMAKEQEDQEGGTRRRFVMDPAEEMVYAFCSVAQNIGTLLHPDISTTNEESGVTLIHTDFGLRQEIWIGTALILLKSFMPCLNWESSSAAPPEMEEGDDGPTSSITTTPDYCSMLYAAQRAYIELLTNVLVHAGSITPSSSIYQHFILSKVHEDTPDLPPSDASPLKNDVIESDATFILEEVTKRFTSPIRSRKIRLSLLCLLTDAWIQQCQRSMSMNYHSQREDEGPVDLDDYILHINENHAQNLLTYLGREISDLITAEKKKPTGAAGEELRSLLACIACVESIAYTAQLSANHLNSTDGNSDEEENARYLVSISMVVLKGQGKIETNENDHEHDDMSSEASASQSSASSSPFRSPRSRARITAFTSECTGAAKRLRRFVGLNDDGSEFESGPVSIDFSSPLLKLPNFGVPYDETDFHHVLPPSQINNQWKIADRITIAECQPADSDFYSAPLDISFSFFRSSEETLDDFHFARGGLLQLCRQLVILQTRDALQRRSYCDWNRVDSYPKFLRPGCLISAHDWQTKHLSSHAVESSRGDKEFTLYTITGSSDPLSVSLTYSVRRQPRFDSEISFISCLTMRVQNITPVSVTNGLALNLRFAPATQHPRSRSCRNEDEYNVDALYSGELKGGQSLTWEILLPARFIHKHNIYAAVTMRDIETDSSSTVAFSNSREAKEQGFKDECKELTSHINVTYSKKVDFDSAEIARSWLIPNPQVFFWGKNRGDDKTFLFLWVNMPHSLPVINIPDDESVSSLFPCFSESSSFELVHHESDQTIKAWALTSCLDRKQLLAIMTSPQQTGTNSSSSTPHRLYIKSDDLQLMEQLL